MIENGRRESERGGEEREISSAGTDNIDFFFQLLRNVNIRNYLQFGVEHGSSEFGADAKWCTSS